MGQAFTAKPFLWHYLHHFLSGVDPYGFRKSQPVVWSKSKTLIAKGFNQVALLFKFTSPCELLNKDLIHRSVLGTARERCAEVYDRLLVTEVKKLCPSQPITAIHKVSKRFVITFLVVITVIILLRVGLGIDGVVLSAEAHDRITSVEDMLAKQDAKIKHQKSLDEFHDKAIETLQSFTTGLANNLHKHEDFSELKQKTVDTNFMISFITSRLLIGNFLIKETNRKWNDGKIYPPFLTISITRCRVIPNVLQNSQLQDSAQLAWIIRNYSWSLWSL